MHPRRIDKIIGRPLLLVITLMSGPVFAQTDISGSWATLRSHEEGWEEPIGD